MRTLFDIGDKIKLTLTGRLNSISLNKDGDCYVVYLEDVGTSNIPIYLSSKALTASKAELLLN